ncbi:glycerol-3-phosphate 1-O-acyltransferase PlsY [[Limnothrix rosea] IAM M-220]|uniref:glycerol-3-phosphate 1-O-acyltransferase PlsY n=1 Tax=[Limnothrix rosea] IAM M-220 TaxID=454133 RepID=UPI0028F418AE|nr:glycerol-3-phosphate 1-O-acyltransferase PlsY [[Limnothrix rosea] IAM M-220]
MPLAIAATFLLIAYLFGSIPTGYLAGKWLQDIDIRHHGSGSTGATNVLRTLGKKAAITVLFCDALKGMIGILLVTLLFAHPEWIAMPIEFKDWMIVGAAFGAVIGHSKSLFLGFEGGKSVATSIGVLLVMTPIVALGTLATFGLVITLSQIVSLSSISGAIAVMILMIVLQKPLPYIIFGVLASMYVIVRHRSNIERIFAGTEPKLGKKFSQGNS